ncbi:MAG: hypothetical protein Q4F85_00450 [Prevotella sp.]|nr:hypothetical protein [Prevotella sp.]
MKTKRLFSSAVLVMSAGMAVAGGLLTNTNQNAAFNRMMSREASIGIDGVYSNPAGVTFLAPGHHLSLNWQMATQTRTVRNTYPLFQNNENNKSTERRFQGDAYAPVIPSIQYAYNWDKFSFQGNFAITGGGGKCEFDNGLGSFEKIVAETAMGACGLAGAIDNVTGMPMFSSDAMFGNTGKYSFNSYMRGRQYYFGLSLGMGYKVNDNLAVYAGVRGVYASCNYYGYVKDIKVGSLPLYQVLDPSKSDAADIELNCDQTGIGFTPILGIDYKTGRWNFSAKYEFKTRIRLKNESVNKTPSIGNLDSNLKNAFIANGVPEQTANAILNAPTVVATTKALKDQFNTKLEEAVGEYTDNKKVAQDIPALLTLGVGYSPIDQVRINAGFHYFFDCQATSYNNRNKLLDRGTIEWNAGVEVDASKLITVSCGWQNTNYGITDEYMDDKSFVTSSNSIGAGACLHVSPKVDVNIAYFTTLYGHKRVPEEVDLISAKPTYTADYTRTNNVFAVGVDFRF